METLLMRELTGQTRVLGILADPIAQVKAPQLINRIAAERGVDAVMVPFHVSAEDLPKLVAGLHVLQSFDGAIVTVPHKTSMIAHCDHLSDRAAAVGAVNVIRREADGRLFGDALDGIGFLAGLRASGIEVAGREIYLAGAGGAANAIAFALAESGARGLTIANRTRSKANDLVSRLMAHFPLLPVRIGTRDPSGHDIIVNGTSLGMKPDDSLPLDVEKLASSMVVCEVVMEPEETALLAAARRQGCRIHLGTPMLMNQVELMADFFRVR